MISDEQSAEHYVVSLGDDRSTERLRNLVQLLVAENREQNLIAATTAARVWQRHIADSVQLLALIQEPPLGPWLDLGTGAGFPGLVISVMQPEWPVVLVESRRRRVAWLERCVDALELTNCRIAGLRIEHLEGFSAGAISARAFAPLPRLIALARRFSTKHTHWLLPKGRSAAQELAQLPVGLRSMFHVEQSVTDPEAGIVVGRGVEARNRDHDCHR